MQLYRTNSFNFGPAREEETIAYGAQAPDCFGVNQWVAFMKAQGIRRICCLLEDEQIDYVYTVSPIKNIYPHEFGENNVCWAGMPDGGLCSRELLKNTIIPFMFESVEKNDKFVVHCMAGIGRTSRILAAFLTHARKLDTTQALRAVSIVEGVDRRPLEGVGLAFSRDQLVSLIEPEGKSNSA